MNQALSLQQLADRLVHVEKEVNIIRKELAHGSLGFRRVITNFSQ